MDIASAMPEGCEVGQEPRVFDLPEFDGRGAPAEMPHSTRNAPPCGRARRTAARRPAGERMEPTGFPLTEEGWLIARCLRGDADAWQTLFELYHPRFVIIVRSLLRGGDGAEHAEEIAAAVWSSLCSKGYSHLRRFDPKAGRLLAYLAAMARREIWRERRSEQRRHARECSVARKEATRDEVGRGLAFNEFLATLTGREREFCLSELLGQGEYTASSPLSAANGWQLRCRVLRKFVLYILQENRRESGRGSSGSQPLVS
jgi:DNA-directed RNA polymerase specialized sigma24 family protein